MKGISIRFLVTFLIAFPVVSAEEEIPVSETEPYTTTEPGGESASSVEDEEEELQSNDPNSIAFYLYPNEKNQSYMEEIHIGDSDSLMESNYSSIKTPLFLIHGFVNNYTCKFSQRVKNALLDAGLGDTHNIIVVDWGAMSTPKNSSNLGSKPLNDLARNPFYQKALRNVPKVGKRVYEFIDFLMLENYLETPGDVYLIGFSLGAQVSGFAGQEVNKNMTIPIGRITGIDPAGPGYNGYSMEQRLDSSDATFVDIVHTNQGQSGYEGNCGDADFYPNGGGPNQNDCMGGSTSVDQITSNAVGICAHNRAWVYYIKALETDVYACDCYATADYYCRLTCPNKVRFGYWAPKSARGTYYVDILTNDSDYVHSEGPVCEEQACLRRIPTHNSQLSSMSLQNLPIK